MPGSRVESWTVLDREGVPVGPVEGFLGFLTGVERSPNTVKAYAHDLKDLFVFLEGRGQDWREVRLEDLGEFVAWLRLPVAGRDGRVLVLPSVAPALAASSVNRKLSAVGAFYEHQARNGVDVGRLLAGLTVPGRRGGSFKPFLHHISKNSPQARRTVGLKAARMLPRVLTAGEAQLILDACGRLRDRVLFAVLWETGMRIGEALGLRHEDIEAAEREISVVPRVNENGARCKSGRSRTIPVGGEVIRLYADYLHLEYGSLDSDYVFVNLWGGKIGHALTYASVHDLVGRVCRRCGVGFEPHWFRHTAATRMLRDGVPLEVVSVLLGHASVSTTSDVYGHLTVEDARVVLEGAGWFAERLVAL